MIFETLLIGLILAVLYVEITDIYPGGIIVPGYIALYLAKPVMLLITIVCALLSLATYRIMKKYFILFGKRRFVLLVLLGVLWSQLLYLFLPRIIPPQSGAAVIGWLIPGLLANNLERQKFWLTLASMLTVAAATYAVVELLMFSGLVGR
ncbi:MAG: poly-gamma-glutamate biosynthesis protein PgsC [Candidatus Aminicenantes bacterium]|nr:poly-gamma-glutamate biosynthesis protein PgsC [Candidatus Aminicenantes bacterium]